MVSSTSGTDRGGRSCARLTRGARPIPISSVCRAPPRARAWLWATMTSSTDRAHLQRFGTAKRGASCRFHHPVARAAWMACPAAQRGVASRSGTRSAHRRTTLSRRPGTAGDGRSRERRFPKGRRGATLEAFRAPRRRHVSLSAVIKSMGQRSRGHSPRPGTARHGPARRRPLQRVAPTAASSWACRAAPQVVA